MAARELCATALGSTLFLAVGRAVRGYDVVFLKQPLKASNTTTKLRSPMEG